jgi:hypothetical protein
MTSLGTLEISNATTVVYTANFIHLEFPDGFAWDVFQNVIEPIQARGVTGTRMRILRTDAPRFRMRGIVQSDTWADAVALAEQLKGYKGYLGALAFSAGGSAFTFTDSCYIWELMPIPRNVQLASAIATQGPCGIVDCAFELQFTQI